QLRCQSTECVFIWLNVGYVSPGNAEEVTVTAISLDEALWHCVNSHACAKRVRDCVAQFGCHVNSTVVLPQMGLAVAGVKIFDLRSDQLSILQDLLAVGLL